MSTLFERLLEICRDQGIADPRNRDVQDLTGLSSGRVTQIKQAQDAGKLGEDTLERLYKAGYSVEWLIHGKLPKRWKESTSTDQPLIAAQTVSPYPAKPPRTIRDRYIADIVAALSDINDHGLAALLEKAKDLTRDYPRRKAQAS